MDKISLLWILTEDEIPCTRSHPRIHTLTEITYSYPSCITWRACADRYYLEFKKKKIERLNWEGKIERVMKTRDESSQLNSIPFDSSFFLLLLFSFFFPFFFNGSRLYNTSPKVSGHRSKHFVYTDWQFRMPSSDVPVNVRGWVVLLMAIRTRVSRDLATLVPDQVPHPSESRVALWTDVTRDTGLRPHVWPFQYPYIWKESGQLVLRRSIRYRFFFVLFFFSLSRKLYTQYIVSARSCEQISTRFLTLTAAIFHTHNRSLVANFLINRFYKIKRTFYFLEFR